jgi:general secretion pathway protein I
MAKFNSKDINSGFTLVEVLVALAIISISLTAVVKATSSDIDNTFYLEKKAIAHLVANEAQALIELNSIGFMGNHTDQETKMGNQVWQWSADKTKTDTNKIVRVDITVFYNKKPIASGLTYLLDLPQ